MKLIASVFLVFFIGCALEPPEKREYVPFMVETTPKERKYYPEETLVFIFNMEILPETISHFKAKGVESKQELDTELEGRRVIVLPPLPQDDILSVEIGSGLKSFDYKPLFVETDSPSKTGKIENFYEIGRKIPEMVRFLPESGSSATVAVSFDGEVDLEKAKIDPLPDKSFTVEEWIALSYLEPIERISFKDVLSVERKSGIEDFEVVLESGKPVESELEVNYFITDESYTVNISDESAIFADVNGVLKVCERRCSVVVENLKPMTKYNSIVTVYTTTGRKTEKSVVETDRERPKIMITEIMHTPNGQPEKSWEFVEIYNYGNLDFDLTDCFIDDNDNNKGIDPLLLRNDGDELILRPGDIAVITGNEAAFGDLIGNALWLVTKDTTVADGGLTSKETVQIKCNRDGVMVKEADEDPKKFSTSRGYSFTVDTEGRYCASSVEGGTPGRIEKCPEDD